MWKLHLMQKHMDNRNYSKQEHWNRNKRRWKLPNQGVIYAARCKKCDELCIGQTHKSTNLRFSGHRYDIKRRPEKENTELATHFSRCDHDFEKDMEVLILQSGLNKSKEEREFHEDRWICRLQTLKPSGINEKLNGYAKEMYQCFTKLHSSKWSLHLYFEFDVK